ncbi:hypothetical protein Phum_PHUM426340 [Pediculus humanus corporis]|uniref:HYR domain-containing protein n=1 Tax=Pediculus humanus subsp. corporis TaxID=121224 RepID=E0VT43_PEDHC|nr:uncharacterized protein Phum_PHUM426340 [Pediculus humanus corporis]EEB16549.1 hypothetical protein Phum_PHUM426340 [Pediculus humanus corporis]
MKSSVFDFNTPPPFILCPPDIRTELPENKFTVFIKIPQPKSNVDWWNYVDSHPSWAKRLEGDFPIGVTSIMFHARSPVSNLTAACRFQVHVFDNEKPKVNNCPESFEVTISSKEISKVITWKEPTFTDNVRIEHVYKSKEPGTRFNVGRHHIRYVATDPSGNQVTCHFGITVKSGENTDVGTKSTKIGRNFIKKLIVCPHLVSDEQLMPSYLVSTRCVVQRQHLTRVMAEYPVQVYQHHRVRHHHDRVITASSRTNHHHHRLTTSFPRRDFMKDEPHTRTGGKRNDSKMTGGSRDVVLKIRGGVRDNSSTVTLDTRSLIEQKTHDRDVARWENAVKNHQMQSKPAPSESNPKDNVRLLEYESKRRQEEERMRRHELEMKRWREDMRKYHMEMKRLQEDSRRYRAG